MSLSAPPPVELASRPSDLERYAGAVVQASSSGTLSLRPVEPGDGEQIHALLTAAIPGILADRARWLRRWQWQYWGNPFRGERPPGWVLTFDKRIVGHLGAVYLPLRFGGEIRIGMIGADYAVSEQAVSVGGMFAGLKLAQTFFDAAGDCIPMATTANEKTCAVFARFGCRPIEWTREFWRAPATVAQLIRSRSGSTSRLARRAFSTVIGRASLAVTGALCGIARYVPTLDVPRGCRLETTVPRLACDLGKLADILVRTAPPTGIHPGHTYLNWRYARHPEQHNIRVITLRDREGQALGAVVVFFEDRGVQRLAIVEEVLAPAGRDDLFRCLLCAALRLAILHRADFLITTTGRHTLRTLYWELCFQSRARSAPALAFRPDPPVDPLAVSSSMPVVTDTDVEFWHGAMF